MAQSDEVLVAAARDGDRAAVEALAARYLPLVYSVVGRGADRDLDVDDIVQDAMVRVVTGVSTVRRAGRFRSWVVTIALRQLADARAEARRARLTRGEDQPDGLPDTADPSADLVGLAVLRQVLDVEQRGIAEAARWLDPAHRTVLSLWWLEAGGHLTRAEVADALDLPAAHAGVRVQRMREQLDVARSVVRALDASPGCPALREVVAGWDGEPDPLWRKRIARHVRDCPQCTERSRRLPAAEGLLAGLPLLAPPPKAAAGGWALKAFALAGGAAALALALVIGVTVWRQPDEPRREVPAARPPATAQAPAPSSPAASPAAPSPSVPPFFATVPAVPKVAEFAPAGAVRQQQRVAGRDNGQSTRYADRSVWIFDDTTLKDPFGFLSNSGAATKDLDASDGIDLTSGSPAAVTVGDVLYAYGACTYQGCKLGKVGLADVTDRRKWTFWTGGGWTADPAAGAFTNAAGAAGQTVFYAPALKAWINTFMPYGSNDVMFQVGGAPFGPWSKPVKAATVPAGGDAAKYDRYWTSPSRRAYSGWPNSA
ncbi:RNA polymerase sigma factor [Dactylosporangium sp. CA-152071]|uniref:RNA polymerase sigma factor n=1 Tax=Dactylosporangium sp. CA-152071 TaxID=3239933 RepID=UPI003D8C000B